MKLVSARKLAHGFTNLERFDANCTRVVQGTGAPKPLKAIEYASSFVDFDATGSAHSSVPDLHTQHEHQDSKDANRPKIEARRHKCAGGRRRTWWGERFKSPEVVRHGDATGCVGHWFGQTLFFVGVSLLQAWHWLHPNDLHPNGPFRLVRTKVVFFIRKVCICSRRGRVRRDGARSAYDTMLSGANASRWQGADATLLLPMSRQPLGIRKDEAFLRLWVMARASAGSTWRRQREKGGCMRRNVHCSLERPERKIDHPDVFVTPPQTNNFVF